MGTNGKKKEERVEFEEWKVRGHDLMDKVKEIIHQGNIRRIVIKNAKGTTFLEIPLTFGVVGAMFAPVWTAIGALAALAIDFRIEVVKDVEEETFSEAAEKKEKE